MGFSIVLLFLRVVSTIVFRPLFRTAKKPNLKSRKVLELLPLTKIHHQTSSYPKEEVVAEESKFHPFHHPFFALLKRLQTMFMFIHFFF
jgi:hypothetical protein